MPIVLTPFPLAVLTWRFTKIAFELSQKRRLVDIADLHCDLAQRLLGAGEKLLGPFHAQAGNVLIKIISRDIFEKFADIINGHVELFGDVLQAHLFILKVIVDIPHNVVEQPELLALALNIKLSGNILQYRRAAVPDLLGVVHAIRPSISA